MADLYSKSSPGLTSPAIDGAMIAPNDGVDLIHVTRALYVGTGGQIAAELASGTPINLVGVTGGSLLPIRVRKILATGTTATNLVGFW